MNPTVTRWPSQRRLSALYAVAIGILVGNVSLTVWNLLSITVTSRHVNRTHDVVRELDSLRVKLMKAELAQTSFLYTGKEGYLRRRDHEIESVGQSFKWLSERIYDVASRRAHLQAVQQAVASETAGMDEAARAPREARMADAGAVKWQARKDAVETQIDAMEEDELAMRQELRTGLNELYWLTIYAFVVVTVLDLILLLGVQYLSYRSRKALALNAEWLATTLRSIGDAVIATDPAGRISFMNPVAEELTGWAESEAVGSPLENVFVVIDEQTREPAINPVGRVLATGATQEFANHNMLVDRGGVERSIDDCASPIKVRDEAIRGVVMVFRDITRDKAARSERERLYQELSERDRRKDEFLAMLAHELRNPLAAIGNAVMLSSKIEMREHLEWSLDVIRRQMRHLSRLIDDLLDVSRISRGKIELRKDRIDASTIIENAIESVRPLIEERQHTLTVNVEPGGLWAEADPTRLEQVIVNLLNNAAKYTIKGGKLELTGRIEEGFVTIVVADTGVGIPPEKLPEMFEIFAQGDRSLARSEGGLGIGLTVVKKLVELHGGTISARSREPIQGSEFTIRIPALMPISGDSNPGETVLSPGSSRILVVDDNLDTVLGISRSLKILGHQVSVAHNGPEAIEAARRTRPEFILLDIVLPGMDGYEVARQLRQEESCRNSVIIAITGYSEENDRHRSKDSGFDHHMAKPLDQASLVMLLSRN